MKVLYASLSEVKKQYDVLEVQSKKTERYKELKDSAFQCEVDIQLLKLKRANDSLTLRQKDGAVLKENLNVIQAEIENLNALLSENMDSVNAMQEDFSARQKELLKLDIERREKETQLQMYSKMEAELNEKIRVGEARIASSQERLASTIEEIDEKRGEILSLKKKYNDIEANIKDFEENITISASKMHMNTEEITKKNLNIKQYEERISTLSHDLKQITEDIVKELDEKLKAQGASSKKREEEGAHLSYLIDKLATLAKGRDALAKDFSSISKKSLIFMNLFFLRNDFT